MKIHRFCYSCDFGLKGLENINRHSFMEIIEDRYGKNQL
jgi:hypothetical protein